MLLACALSINVWLLSAVLARFFLPCLSVEWSVLLSVLSASLLVSMCVHMYTWRCWKYLWHRPRRLRSFHRDRDPPKCHCVLLLWLWLMAGSATLATCMCAAGRWPWSLLGFIPAVFYTAANAGRSSSEDSSPESSSVNADSSRATAGSDCDDVRSSTSSVGDSVRGAVN